MTWGSGGCHCSDAKYSACSAKSFSIPAGTMTPTAHTGSSVCQIPSRRKRAEWYQAALNAADPEQALAAFVSGIVTILDRSAPLAPVLASAATLEPMIAEHLGHTEQLRVDGYLAFIRHLHRNGLLRPGLSVEVATDVLLTLLGPATYVAFTRGRAWSHSQYLRWITPALLELLIKDRRSSRSRRDGADLGRTAALERD